MGILIAVGLAGHLVLFLFDGEAHAHYKKHNDYLGYVVFKYHVLYRMLLLWWIVIFLLAFLHG